MQERFTASAVMFCLGKMPGNEFLCTEKHYLDFIGKQYRYYFCAFVYQVPSSPINIGCRANPLFINYEDQELGSVGPGTRYKHHFLRLDEGSKSGQYNV